MDNVFSLQSVMITGIFLGENSVGIMSLFTFISTTNTVKKLLQTFRNIIFSQGLVWLSLDL